MPIANLSTDSFTGKIRQSICQKLIEKGGDEKCQLAEVVGGIPASELGCIEGAIGVEAVEVEGMVWLTASNFV